jgi:excisionase family DNA binding protein
LDKERLLPISIICLAVSILISAGTISKGLKKAAEINSNSISFGITSSLSNMSNALNSMYYSQNTSGENDIMNVDEAAAYLGIPAEEFLNALNDKSLNIPYAQAGYRYVFSKQALSKWLETSHRSANN